MAMHVYDSGDGHGRPVVLLHSSGMSGDQWRRAGDELVADGMRVIIPDLLGAGRSPDWPDGKSFTFRDDVAAVDELIRPLGPVHLVGHSYGGLLALQLALQPARVASLAVYDPVAFGVLAPSLDHDALASLAHIQFWNGPPSDDQRDAWLQTFVDYWGGSGAFARLSSRSRAEFARVAWVVHEGVRSLVSDTTPASAYAHITAPVLLMGGADSPLAARRVITRLAEAIPNATVETVAGAGHMGPLTHSSTVNALLRAHVAAYKNV